MVNFLIVAQSPYYIHVYMSVIVSCGHLTRGLEIISEAIPMASSCPI